MLLNKEDIEMKKNKLLFGIGMISIILLSSCGETFTKNRGQEETFPEVSIPDVLRPTEGNQDKDSITYTVKHALEMENGEYQTVCVETLSSKKGEKTNASPKAYNGYKAEEFSQVDVEADGSTVVTIKYKMQKYSITLTGNQFEGSLAGSGEYSIVDGAAVLTAKPYIGYSFLGWYRDDTLLSNKPTYSLTLSSDMNIKGLFKIKDEFKNYEIETNESSCTILKQLDDKERVVSIPEGVTGIAYNAFNSYCLRILTLPKSLKRIESQAFYTPSLVKITINSDCIFYDGAFDSVYPIEVYDLSENGHNEYFMTYADLHRSLEDESRFEIDQDGFIWGLIEDYTHENTLRLFGRVEENSYEIVFPKSHTMNGITYNEYTIYSYAFYKDKVKVVTLNDSITSIDNYAFGECSNLVELFNFSNMNITIDPPSYDNGSINRNLKIIHLDEDEEGLIKSYGDFDYYLKDIDGITYAVIVNCTNIEENFTINAIGNYPTLIGENAFKGNTKIKSLTLGDNIIGIEKDAFYDCTSLEALDLKDVKYIDENAFCYSGVKKVNLPKCEIIGPSAFNRCNVLNEVNAPQVKEIGSYAFYNAFALYQFTLPKTLEEIEDNAFGNCNNLIELINLSNLDLSNTSANGYISANALNIISDEKDSKIRNTNGFITYKDTEDTILLSYDGDSKDIVIPSNITIIYPYAFTVLELDSLKIGENVEELNRNSLYLSKIQELSIYLTDDKANSIEKLKYLFKEYLYDEYALDTIIVDGTIANIPEDFFYWLNVKTFVLPSTIESTSNDSFNVSDVEKVYFNGDYDRWNNISFPTWDTFFQNEDAPIIYFKDLNGTVTFKENTYVPFEVLYIPEGVTSIDDYKYQYYTVKEVVIPEGVTEIGERAFQYCKNLEKITLPSTLETIDYGAFENCSKLSDVTLPNGLLNLGYAAFINTGITSITIPSSVNNINGCTFENCRNLLSVTYNTNADIESSMFSGCSVLQSVKITGEPEEIGSDAFRDCKSLKKITLPNSITYIDDNAFNNSGIKSIDLSELSLSSIEYSTFQNCKYLTNITLPTTITSIGKSAFAYTGIKEFTISSNIDSIADNLFEGCMYLETITLENGVTTISDKAFLNCRSLRTLNLPESLNEIGFQSFMGCTSLNDITLPEGLTKLDNNAFDGCQSLKKITLPSTLTSIGAYVFKDCPRIEYNTYMDGNYLGDDTNPYRYFIEDTKAEDEFTLHADCKIIARSPFNMSNVSKVTIPNGVLTLPKGLFIGAYNLADVTIPFVGDNKSNNTFSYFYDSTLSRIPTCLTKVTITSGDTIQPGAFSGCSTIKTIVLPDTITTIGNNAFQNSGIESINIGENIIAIGSNAFSGCTNLESIDLSSMDMNTSGASLGANIFNGATKLKEVLLPKNIKSIPQSMFMGCVKLEEFTISETVTTLGNSSFSGCSSLESVQVLGNLQSIGESAFYECKLLEEFTLPSTLTSIGASAFYNTGLKDITIPSGMTTIGNYAFMGCKALYNVCNLSSLSIKAGQTTYGYVGYYAKSIHTNINDKAYLVKNGDFEFLIDKGTVYLMNYLGDKNTKKDLTLPSTVTYENNTYTEYIIDKNCFRSASYINTVIIPSSVTKIEDNAFYSSGITGIQFLGNSIEYVGANAFQYCSLLDGELTLPAGTYGASAFYYCNRITSVKFKEGETILGASVLSMCSLLTHIELAEGLLSIGDEAFAYLNIEEITFPKSLKTIGNSIFYSYNSTTLHTIILQENSNLESIGEQAFYNAVLVGNLPNTLNKIEKNAFYYYKGTEITIPSSVETIGNYAFQNSSLEEVTIHSDILGYGMFYNCQSLANVTMDGNIESIPEKCFGNCSSLSSITIPSTVTSIGASAFYESGIESITIPSTVTSMGGSIFSNCAYLASVQVLANVEALPAYMFYYCQALTTVSLPNTLTSIGDHAFYSCTLLEAITIPSTVNTFGDYAFSGCLKLNNVVLPTGTVKIADYMFRDCTSLNNITLPNTVTEIGQYAFQNCGFTALEIWDSITKIGQHAFRDCKSILSIKVPSTVTTVNTYAFYGNTSLQHVEFLANTTTVTDRLFYNCSQLKTIVLGESITKIGTYTFDGTNLSKVYHKSTTEVTFNTSSGNTKFTNATKYWYSETEPATDGNYWHYETNGEVLEW